MSELIVIIPRDDFGEGLIKAGHAYGVGKQLRGTFPTPAILMFCSALNLIGKAPNVQLKEQISATEETLAVAGSYAGYDTCGS